MDLSLKKIKSHFFKSDALPTALSETGTKDVKLHAPSKSFSQEQRYVQIWQEFAPVYAKKSFISSPIKKQSLPISVKMVQFFLPWSEENWAHTEEMIRKERIQKNLQSLYQQLQNEFQKELERIAFSKS